MLIDTNVSRTAQLLLGWVLLGAGCASGVRQAPVIEGGQPAAAPASQSAASGAAGGVNAGHPPPGVVSAPEVVVHPAPYARGPSRRQTPAPGAAPTRTPAAGRSVPLPAAGSGSSSAAVVALAQGAARAQQRGRLPQAAAGLERALRIAPRNASLWYQLAQIRYQQHHYGDAEQLAIKAASLSRAVLLSAAIWRLVADVRQARGDLVGARQARARALRP